MLRVYLGDRVEEAKVLCQHMGFYEEPKVEGPQVGLVPQLQAPDTARLGSVQPSQQHLSIGGCPWAGVVVVAWSQACIEAKH